MQICAEVAAVLRIPDPMSALLQELVANHNVSEGIIYARLEAHGIPRATIDEFAAKYRAEKLKATGASR
jgi:hypothetical protein